MGIVIVPKCCLLARISVQYGMCNTPPPHILPIKYICAPKLKKKVCKPIILIGSPISMLPFGMETEALCAEAEVLLFLVLRSNKATLKDY